jgi:hypothetical protein
MRVVGDSLRHRSHRGTQLLEGDVLALAWDAARPGQMTVISALLGSLIAFP